MKDDDMKDDDMKDDAETLMERALQARRENRPEDAKRDWNEAVAMCRRNEAPANLARALCGLGQIERDLNRNDAALPHYQEAVAVYRSAGNVLQLAHAVRHVGDIFRHEKKHELAQPCYDEALDLYRSHPKTSPLDLANALRGWAILKEEIGGVAEARAAWLEARDLYASVNVDAGVTESAARLARLSESRALV